jgi:hypothetical protein
MDEVGTHDVSCAIRTEVRVGGQTPRRWTGEIDDYDKILGRYTDYPKLELEPFTAPRIETLSTKK